MKLKIYIATAFLFTFGNLLWRNFDDPGVYYVPLALFLLSGVSVARSCAKPTMIRTNIFLDWILLMAAGNVIKQIFYNSDDVSQLNDKWWGLFLAVYFIPKLIYPNIYSKLFKFLKSKWAIQNTRKNGGKG